MERFNFFQKTRNKKIVSQGTIELNISGFSYFLIKTFWLLPSVLVYFLRLPSLRTKMCLKLTHSFPMHPFSSSWKHQKNVTFSDVFMGERKGAFGTNGLSNIQCSIRSSIQNTRWVNTQWLDTTKNKPANSKSFLEIEKYTCEFFLPHSNSSNENIGHEGNFFSQKKHKRVCKK